MMFEHRGKTFLIIGILVTFLIGSAVVFFFGLNVDKDWGEVQVATQARMAAAIPDAKPAPVQILPDFSVYRDDLLKNSQGFLEIDLQQKQVYLYQQGQVVKTAENLKIGRQSQLGRHARWIV